MVFIYAIISVVIVSLLSLLGALFLVLNRRTFDGLITYTLAVSSGILLGSTFFDLLPQAHQGIGDQAFALVVVGLIVFFSLEKIIKWHHCTDGEDCPEKPLAYLNLVGDSIHNFLDGAIIAVAFLTNVPLGVTTTLAVIAHEIPHELSDFTILIYGGFTNQKALWYNFISALTSVLGCLFVFIFSKTVLTSSPYLIAFAAGNFLYIASSDIIPELHSKRNFMTSIIQTLAMIMGVASMGILSNLIAG